MDNKQNIEKLDMTTPNITDANVARIAELFPNVVTEGRDENGKLTHVVDFDALKQELSDSIVEGPQERYRLDWPGKREAMLAANTPITKTLRPVREESVDFDTTKNLFIEGDNLDALKLLQETYLGKVKMIYIDPPYNTGKDFIYKDNFTGDKQDYLEDSGQVDEEGGKLVANPESNGRYHSDWLSMMYPRLKLARNLLRDDGNFLISLDENEINNARIILDEIFGKTNFVGTIAWESKTKSQNTQGAYNKLQPKVEYILLYTRASGRRFNLRVAGEKAYPEIDEKGKYRLHRQEAMSAQGIRGRETMIYDMLEISPPEGRQWQVGKETYEKFLSRDDVFLDGQTPVFKMRPGDERGSITEPFWGFFSKDCGTAESAKKELSGLLDGKIHAFDTVKPTQILSDLIFHCTKQGDIVLDFFAGSGSTHNASFVESTRSGERTVISVQLGNASTNVELKEASDFDDVSQLSKERIRQAGKKVLEENSDQAGTLDVGFRVLKIDSSNMNDVYYAPGELEQGSLLDAVEHIKPDRTAEDLLFQVMLDWGVDLALPITLEVIDGKTVYWVGEDNLAACFDLKITENIIKAMAERKPLRAVFRDDGFGSDDMKINAGQLFAQMTDGHTDMKVI
ncbi:adenine-specific DNA-methyltransferase [Litorimonas taeanensis]|uniref:site-specific DNA-methyltransferase (adenine-specific) n=1 Tax=Litorimonas taeanensis TaxID=568099 RepID=A0A420WFE7_9PROT|nr:site-specific DNA-methyltransferase [Litorimonas taeanensis]RKQ69720.1 adenine-specific DNA-methyltransferase [Litorimonas taeanensis]